MGLVWELIVDFASSRSRLQSAPKQRSAGSRALLLATALGLCFTIGCSSTSNSSGGGGSGGGGGKGFTNASLSGNYTYNLGGSFFGSSANGFYKRQGTFVADGNGNITTGSDDLVQGSAPSTSAVTGSYNIASDGTGLMMLSIGGTQLQWALTMTSDAQLTLIEFDSFASGAGGANLQTTSAFTSTPSGTFIFNVHSFQANNASLASVSSVGSMNFSASTVTGNEDVVRAGVFSSATLTGTLSAPDATGKGSLSLTDSEGFASTYFFYVIDSNTLDLLETDSDTNGPHFGAGRADTQSGTPFTKASLKNGFVFTSSGDTESTIFGVVSVGGFTSDGNGNIISGSYDSAADGVPVSNAALGGTYTVDSNGRAVISLTSKITGLTSIPYVAWFVSPSRAFFLVDIPGISESGTLFQQTSSSFAGASLNGQFSFSMFGHDNQSPPQVNRVGVATFNGNATLTLADYFVNRSGSRNQTNQAGVTYAVGSNGRVTASIPGITNTLVLYLISNSSGYMILEDPETEIAGGVTQQTAP